MIKTLCETLGFTKSKLKNVLDENQNVMGIICVPRHSNPSGEVYTDENINGIFSIGKAYSDKFLFLFDHAYLIHDFLPTKKQTPTWQLALNNNTNNQTVIVIHDFHAMF